MDPGAGRGESRWGAHRGRAGRPMCRAGRRAHRGSGPTHQGRDTSGILAGLVDRDLEALVLLGADPIRDVPDGRLAREAIAAAGFVVAIDLFLNDSSELADVVLPAESFGEKEGTLLQIPD